MLTVDDYAKIRVAHRDGMSIRAIARTFEHSRRKVREILANPQPTPYTRAKPKPAPVLGSFHAVIDAVLADDENAPPKQRHTSMQLFRSRKRCQVGFLLETAQALGLESALRPPGRPRKQAVARKNPT